MNIIETVKQAVQQFPRINDVCGDIHVDFTDGEPTSYGLSSTGDTLLTEDVIGNQVRQHTFVLYAVYQSMNDYDRISNSGALLELQYYLERYANNTDIAIDSGVSLAGMLQKITCANGTLYAVPNGTEQDGWIYQIQISAKYTIERM